MNDLFNTVWKYHTHKIPTHKEIKERVKAVIKIEENFCPSCKKRFNKITSEESCMDIFVKINNGKFRGVRCKAFKRMNNGQPQS